MLQDMIHPPENLPIDEVSSPISSQILELCDTELFKETMQNSEDTSCSNYCYEENSNSYSTYISFPNEIVDKFDTSQNNNVNTTSTSNTTTTTTTSTATTATASTNITPTNNDLCVILDSQDDLEIGNELSASIDFSSSPTFMVPPFLANTLQGQFNFSANQLTLTEFASADPVPQFMVPQLPLVFEEDCLSSVPSFVPLNPSSPSACSFLCPPMSTYMPTGPLTAALSADSPGIFTESILLGSGMNPQGLEFKGDNGGIYCQDSLPGVINPGDLQALGHETQQLVSGVGTSAPFPTEISSLEDSTFKVGKLSVEQRKEKIHRYMKKRNERNFSKKIKYACRKTLADSRPRVRGRFAKNDDFGDVHRAACSNHEEEDEDETIVKEEEGMVDSADIFAHISGVNSFKYNYNSIPSWI